MESVHELFRVALPRYFKSLPIPRTFSRFMSLTAEQYLSLLPVTLIFLILMHTVTKVLRSIIRRKKVPKAKVNLSLQKEDPKVVTQMDIEDLPDKIAFCRCWRSKKFPLCDGSHNQHNAECRDNVGPLLLRRSGDE